MTLLLAQSSYLILSPLAEKRLHKHKESMIKIEVNKFLVWSEGFF